VGVREVVADCSALMMVMRTVDVWMKDGRLRSFPCSLLWRSSAWIEGIIGDG